MKKRALCLALMSLVAVSLAACGKQNQDTGVIVTVGDKNVDTTQTEKTISEDSAEEVTDTESTSENQAPVVDENSIVGQWDSDDGNVYIFSESNEFTISSYTDESLSGTYETDNNSYLKLTYEKPYEYSEDEQEALEEYEKLAEEEGTYAWIKRNCSRYDILNHDEAAELGIEIDEGTYIMIGYDEDGNEVARTEYDPEADISNQVESRPQSDGVIEIAIEEEGDNSTEPTPTPEPTPSPTPTVEENNSNTITIEYTLKTGKTEYGDRALQLIDGDKTINLVKR